MAQRQPRNNNTDHPGRSSGSVSKERRPLSSDSRPAERRNSGQARQRRTAEDERYLRENRQRSSYPPNRNRRRRKKSKGPLAALIIILVLILAGVVFVLKSGILNKEEVIEVVKPVPEAPRVVKTASIGATGDVILHMPILYSHQTWDGYDFSYCFANIAPVFEQTDLMIANLEVTLGGPESGEYSGFPGFNSPDEIAPALKNAGVDMCLTANNHSNDTGYYGMMRTLDVLDENGLEHLGSRESTDEHFLWTKNINGIRLGMLCYTYDTREYTEGERSLNFNWLSDEAVQKIQTFNYEYLDEFYSEVEEQLRYMDMLNIDSKIIFMHWGTEYQDYPNAPQQTDIAQRLCDMGFDVIIGGHPHVIQEFDTLRSPDGHEAVCLYSMGNALSNQRREEMDPEEPRGYTEDGLVMQITFEKFNNGNTKVGAVNFVPTWVQLDVNGYQIIGLEQDKDPWSWGSSDTYAAIESYNRTMERLGPSYNDYRLRKHQNAAVEYIE